MVALEQVRVNPQCRSDFRVSDPTDDLEGLDPRCDTGAYVAVPQAVESEVGVKVRAQERRAKQGLVERQVPQRLRPVERKPGLVFAKRSQGVCLPQRDVLRVAAVGLPVGGQGASAGRSRRLRLPGRSVRFRTGSALTSRSAVFPTLVPAAGVAPPLAASGSTKGSDDRPRCGR